MSFPKDFLWGAASAAYQIEGAYNEGGKGPGIWDALSEGHIKHGENGNTACDHYHRYQEDVQLMKEMGLKTYRFSVSWPRIMPQEGEINEEGIQFYQNLVSELRAAGIEPLCTLFHWNLPMWIYEKGGWKSETTPEYFAAYAKVVVEALSDKVTYWMTMNEPACFIGNGHITGSQAPFESALDDPASIPSKTAALSKNVLLAHGKAVQIIRKYAKSTPKIGIALNGTLIEPLNESTEAIEAAKNIMFSDDRLYATASWWADPMLTGRIPEVMQRIITDEEAAQIRQPLDFLGYNCYNTGNYDDGVEKEYPGLPRNSMGWPITPNALYWAAHFLYERYHMPILITENGMPNLDFVMSDGKVHDPQRIEYMKAYLKGLEKAIQEGIPVIGYTYWSVMDNFEWSEGYDPRFGLIYIDYRTQKRIRKDSSYWYERLIRTNEFPSE